MRGSLYIKVLNRANANHAASPPDPAHAVRPSGGPRPHAMHEPCPGAHAPPYALCAEWEPTTYCNAYNASVASVASVALHYIRCIRCIHAPLQLRCIRCMPPCIHAQFPCIMRRELLCQCIRCTFVTLPHKALSLFPRIPYGAKLIVKSNRQ